MTESRHNKPPRLTLDVTYPETLPIVEKRGEIVAAIRDNQVIIIAGETGSGKTTQIPKMCLEAGLGLHGQIGCTQPRRIAALSVSRRLAEELSVSWGDEVGCKIRFSDYTKPSTRIKVMTDGVLLAETRSDPLLRRYEALIIDEAHERSLNIDFLLGYLKTLITKRPDLKVIITSATIDTELFSKAFNGAPIFEVSGRLYPVEIRYEPLLGSEEDEDPSYVDGAIRAVEVALEEVRIGDVLVFMPTERDIRETCERLGGRLGTSVEVLPLMGSLSAGEQERVFAVSAKRKVIVATNIAETSLTIPRIRYVIDTGLARVSRYSGRQRTKRLPVERISKSSANQRAGRAGRVQEGVCIRLFAEDEFEGRQDFADPEILRANLAEVILRMRAFNLGEIESFPFLNPPDARAVQSGYALLYELGALDETNALTSLGRELAKLPVDPTIGRILLQARREHILAEAVVLAAGLSIQDPRERPVDKREAADKAHKTFAHPDSDFLTLLAIWQGYAEKWKQTRSQSQVRKFCKSMFLSYARLREWGDLITELQEVMGLQGGEVSPVGDIKCFDGRYRAIHRSIVSGFIGQVAYRTERNTYRAAGGRELAVFPGSVLAEKKPLRKDEQKSRAKHRHNPEREQWIVSGEIVETSQLFARTVARVQQGWIEELGKHLCKRQYEEPGWVVERGAVMARERVSLYGLTLAYRRVPFNRSHPKEAAEIFVRSTLIVEDSPFAFPVLSENRRLADRVATLLARHGRLNRLDIEEKLAAFYIERLPGISTKADLERFVSDCQRSGSNFLKVTQEYFAGSEMPAEESDLFPDSIEIAGTPVQVYYRYEPGGERDGVTLAVPLALAQRMPARVLDRAIPGLHRDRVRYLIGLLPKEQRRRVEAIPDVVERVSKHARIGDQSLVEAIVSILQEEFGVVVSRDALSLESLPVHLRTRIELLGERGIVAVGRDLSRLLEGVVDADVEHRSQHVGAWGEVRAIWERTGITTWSFGDLPEFIEVAKVGGIPVSLYPGLCAEDSGVALRLFDSKESAIAASRGGVQALAECVMTRDVQELRRQARDADLLKPLITLYCSQEQLREQVVSAAVRHLFEDKPSYPLREGDFQALLRRAQSKMPNLVRTIVATIKLCLETRKALISAKRPYAGMRDELEALLPATFPSTTPYEHLQHLPRYLKGMLLRCERADNDPQRDRQRMDQLRPYCDLLRLPDTPSEFRWMVEEFKVSLFAQELGTRYPVSPKRLDAWLATHSSS
jgi:ATP-dependent helicase HrpA